MSLEVKFDFTPICSSFLLKMHYNFFGWILQLILTGTLAVWGSLSAQTIYTPAYLIETNGTRIEGEVGFPDWPYNPETFLFKDHVSGKEVFRSVRDVAEVGTDEFVFRRFVVELDKSLDDDPLSNTSNRLVMELDTLLLQVILDGEISLYRYLKPGLKRFFLKRPDAPIAQLKYKRYSIDGVIIRYNRNYRQQLFRYLKCGYQEAIDFEEVKYGLPSLLKAFETYHQYNDLPYQTYTYRFQRRKNAFHLALQAGMIQRRFGIVQIRGAAAREADFGSGISPIGGIQLEYQFSEAQNRIAILAEGSVWRFSSTVPVDDQEATADYTAIHVGLGLRGYIPVSSRIKVYGGIIGLREIALLGSGVTFSVYGSGISMRTRLNGNLVLGGMFGDRVGLEARYVFRRRILELTPVWNDDFSTFIALISFRLF